MNFSFYLNFKGQCAEAFKFYERVFGGKITSMVPFADTPMASQVPDEWRGKICHASLLMPGASLMGCDPAPARFDAPEGFNITIGTKDPKEAERIFNALAENGKVIMPLQKTFWAVSFGMLHDQFGIPWMINCSDNPE